jgi:hypothetical protein
LREQAPVDVLHRRAGGHAQFVTQQYAQPVVGEQRLGDVSAPLEGLDENPVAGLAVRSQFDQLARAVFGLCERRAAELEPRFGEILEPA